MNLLLIVIIGAKPFLTHDLRGRNSSRPRGNHLEGYPRPGSCYLNVLLISRCNPLDILRILHSGFQKSNKQHLECLIVNLQVGFQKTVSLASNNNLSESLTNLVWLPKTTCLNLYICLYMLARLKSGSGFNC
jgi:hypothetical protein